MAYCTAAPPGRIGLGYCRAFAPRLLLAARPSPGPPSLPGTSTCSLRKCGGAGRGPSSSCTSSGEGHSTSFARLSCPRQSPLRFVASQPFESALIIDRHITFHNREAHHAEITQRGGIS